MKYGFDPILLEKVQIKDWLEEDPDDNIVIILEDIKTTNPVVCLKKSYFLNPHMNDIYKFCSVYDDTLMIDETYKSTDFRNIGFYLDDYLLINNTDFIKKLKINNAFVLKPSEISKTLTTTFNQGVVPGSRQDIKVGKMYYNVEVPDGIVPGEPVKIKHVESDPKFISQELLELSQIGLKKVPSTLKLTKIKLKTICPTFTPKEIAISKAAEAAGEYSGIVKPFYYNQKAGKAAYPYDCVPGEDVEIELYVNAYEENIPYEEQVYFDKVLANSLYDYSFGWDAAINYYLREGDAYFNSEFFKEYQYKYGNPQFTNLKGEMIAASHSLGTLKAAKKILDKYAIPYPPATPFYKLILLLKKLIKDFTQTNIELGKKNIKDKILQLDKCFLEAAPRVSTVMSNKYFYRGMTKKYAFTNIGDEIIASNFTSLSSSIDVAKKFGINKQTHPDNEDHICCLYKFSVTKGMPYINMINTTKYKSEKEILLPRQIKLKLIKEELGGQQVRWAPGGAVQVPYKIYYVKASPLTPDQFKIDSGCESFAIVKITPKKIEGLLTSKTPQTTPIQENLVQMVPENVSNELEETVHKLKLPRCPKGTRRNPKTKKCDPTGKKKSPQTKKAPSTHCKGLSEDECNKLNNCKYSKGAKRQYCRTKKNKT